jgi:RNA polymerase sigma factor (TIGR02999 family)
VKWVLGHHFIVVSGSTSSDILLYSTVVSFPGKSWDIRDAVAPMSEVTRILSAIEDGDPHAAEQLLPLVYDELRKLAASKLAHEKPGQTLEATALVHEAYLRLVDAENAQRWDSRAHFFAAAAEAMRRILIDNARRKQTEKHGGGWQRHELLDSELAIDSTGEELFAVDVALSRLAAQEPVIARLVELRCFAGLTLVEAAQCLNLSERTAYRHWAYARAWLRRELDRSGESRS